MTEDREYSSKDYRRRRLLEGLAEPFNDGVDAADKWGMDFRYTASGDVLRSVLEDQGWNSGSPVEMDRLVVNPHDEVEDGFARRFVPERSYSELMREYCDGRIEGAEDMSDEQLGEVFWESSKKESLELLEELHSDLNDFMQKVSEKALEEEHEEVDSIESEGFEGILEFHRNQNCEFQGYSGDTEQDLERAVHNTHERAERYFADTLSKTWIQIFEQELYMAGWDYQDEELFTVYSVRDDGFIDFRQFVV